MINIIFNSIWFSFLQMINIKYIKIDDNDINKVW